MKITNCIAILIIFFLVFTPFNGFAQINFQKLQPFELPFESFAVHIDDFDSDSDPDFIFISKDSLIYPNSLILENVNGIFLTHNIGNVFLDYCNISSADLDNDGDKDLLLTGINPATKAPLSKIFYFTDFTIQESSIELIGVFGMENSICDVDLDGDQDIIIGGSTQFERSNQQNITRLYVNQNNTFIESTVRLKASYGGKISAVDLENDGDNDIVIYGEAGTQINIYENQSGIFHSLDATLTQATPLIAKLIDIDNDGYKDLFLMFKEPEQGIIKCKFYKNFQNSFTEISNTLLPINNGDIVYADLDNNGTKELLISGQSESGSATKVYKVIGLDFIQIENDLPGISDGTITVIDINSDGENELIYSGYDCNNNKILKIYKSML